MKPNVLSCCPCCEPEKINPEMIFKAVFVSHPLCNLFLYLFHSEHKEPGRFHSPLHSSSIVSLSQLPVRLSSSALCKAQQKRIWLKRKKVFQIKIWRVLVSSLGFRQFSSLPCPFSQKLQGGQYHLQYLKLQQNPS